VISCFERENGILSNDVFPGEFPEILLISCHFSRQLREVYALHSFSSLFFSDPNEKKKMCTEGTLKKKKTVFKP